MRKTLTTILIAVFALAVSIPAFAAVQNVKVSGDITARGIIKGSNNLNPGRGRSALMTSAHLTAIVDGNGNAVTYGNQTPLPRSYASIARLAPSDFSSNPAGTVAATGGATQSIMMSTAVLNVTADLTDNVSTEIRLLNQRDWGATNNNPNVELGLANAKIKELLYAPLTLTIGRQNLWFGKGFIVGSYDLNYADPNNGLAAKEFGANVGFDAIRATLDYNPLTVDLVYSLIGNSVANLSDDVFLTGINAGYKLGMWNAEVEGYYWYYQDGRFKNTDPADINRNLNNTDMPANVRVPDDKIHTIGLRGSAEPVSNLNVAGEVAWQGGKSWAAGLTFPTVQNAYISRDRNALAVDVSADYTFVNLMWEPKLGGEYIFYSGEKPRDERAGIEAPNVDMGWHMMFRGKYDTLIREFQGGYLPGKSVLAGLYILDDVDAPPAFTNQHQFAIYGALKPIPDVKINGRWTYFLADKGVDFLTTQFTNDTRSERYLGNELDVKVTYNYTEDVSLDLVGGWFWPGAFFTDGNQGADLGPANQIYNRRGRGTAYTLLGSVSVVF